jgi:enoyl-CoA hydratase/carnithine racemase
MSDESILVTGPDDGVAIITLNRPFRRNALTFDMGEVFGEAIDQLKADSNVRAVVLTGAGSSFCAGADFSLLQGWQDANPEAVKERMLCFYKLFLRVQELEVPTIAAVAGGAIGAGCCLALACDIRLAADSAKMALNFVQLGINPGMGGTYNLPAIVGPAIAMELIATGRIVTGSEAARIGLVNRAVPADKLQEEALAMAKMIATAAPPAVRRAKQGVQMALGGAELEHSLEFEAESQAFCFSTPDYAQAMQRVARRSTKSKS